MNDLLKSTVTGLLKHKANLILLTVIVIFGTLPVLVSVVCSSTHTNTLRQASKRHDSLLTHDSLRAAARLNMFMQKHSNDSLNIISQYTIKHFDTTIKRRNTSVLLKSPFRKAWVVVSENSKKATTVLEDFCLQDINVSAYIRGAKYQELNACLEKIRIDSAYDNNDTVIEQTAETIYQQRSKRIGVADLKASLELRNGIAYFIVFRYHGDVVNMYLPQDTLGTYVVEKGFAFFDDGSWNCKSSTGFNPEADMFEQSTYRKRRF